MAENDELVGQLRGQLRGQLLKMKLGGLEVVHFLHPLEGSVLVFLQDIEEGLHLSHPPGHNSNVDSETPSERLVEAASSLPTQGHNRVAAGCLCDETT